MGDDLIEGQLLQSGNVHVADLAVFEVALLACEDLLEEVHPTVAFIGEVNLA